MALVAYKVIFGKVTRKDKNVAEDVAESYVSQLFHNGQAAGEYFLTVRNGKLTAYLVLFGTYAESRKHDSEYVNKGLKKVKVHFGRQPTWYLIDDIAPRRDTTWAGAPFLYLATGMFDWESPLRRGDNGKPIPLYRLPGPHEAREAVYFWQRAYREYDSIWMGCGELEIPVYRQLADPTSELSRRGREICRVTEEATGVPAYYFLLRYWGRRTREESRKCPGCGRAWRVRRTTRGPDHFWNFAFQCHRCRLVSHLANSYDDERHAAIGEPKKQR